MRYRGYYYDTETGFYYLQSRYYDPEICRFINADSYASTGDGFTGLNMFAYCNNNPILYLDSSGEVAVTAIILIISAAVGVTVAAVTAYESRKSGCDWADTAFYSLGNGLCAFTAVYSFGMTAYNVYLNFCAINGTTPVTEIGTSKVSTPTVSVYGTSQAPKTQEPNSVYNKVDAVDGTTVVSTTKYNSQGLPSSRNDYYVGTSPHTHYDKSSGMYLYDHVHFFYYNKRGYRIGERVDMIK